MSLHQSLSFLGGLWTTHTRCTYTRHSTHTQVIVRVRPLLEGERNRQAQHVVECASGPHLEDRRREGSVTVRVPRRSVRCT